MPFDADSDHEYEPAVPDPEADLPDYEEELPSIPDVRQPGEDAADAPPGLVLTFWGLVLVFNIALMALALGAMFVLIAGRLTIGGNFLFVGALLGAYGLYRYWTSPYRGGHPDDSTAVDTTTPTTTDDSEPTGASVSETLDQDE